MSGWTDATCNAILDDQLGTAVRTAPTAPMKLALETAAGTGATAGTEGTGYTRPTIAFTAAASKQAPNSGALTVPVSVAQTFTAVAIYDSAAAPVRKAWGPLSAPRTVAAGDSLAFAAGSVVVTQTN